MTDQPTPAPEPPIPFTVEQITALAALVLKEINAHSTLAPADVVANSSRNFRDFLEKATALAPDVAKQFTGKALVASKTPWGTIVGTAVGLLAAKYGLTCGPVAAATATCWTPETVTLVSGLLVLGCTLISSFVMRYISPLPVTGILTAATPAQAAATITKGTAP